MRMNWIIPVVYLVAGCAKDEPLQPHQATDAAAPAATAPAESATTATVPATAAPAVPAGIASADGEQSGVSLTVTELKRSSGDTVTLKFTIVNKSDKEFDFGYNLGDSSLTSDYGSVGGIHLIDPVNKKKYFVVRDSENKCVCSRDLKKVDPGSSMSLWGKYPAPPDTQKVSVVVPHFIPMDDVPIS